MVELPNQVLDPEPKGVVPACRAEGGRRCQALDHVDRTTPGNTQLVEKPHLQVLSEAELQLLVQVRDSAVPLVG